MTAAPGHSHLIAYDLVSGDVVLVGTDARYMLAFMGDHMWPRVDLGLVEVLDVGTGGVGHDGRSVPLAEARARGRTVYRGVGVDGMPPVSLDAAAETDR